MACGHFWRGAANAIPFAARPSAGFTLFTDSVSSRVKDLAARSMQSLRRPDRVDTAAGCLAGDIAGIVDDMEIVAEPAIHVVGAGIALP
jgi:hypothetical protein